MPDIRGTFNPRNLRSISFKVINRNCLGLDFGAVDTISHLRKENHEGTGNYL